MGYVTFLVFVVIIGAVVGLAVWVMRNQKRQAQLMNEADEGAFDDDVCVSCGSSQITRPEPDIILCEACGYEGGEGLKRRQEEASARRIASMAPQERLKSAMDDLVTAMRLLDEANQATQPLPPDTSMDLATMTGWGTSSVGGNEEAMAAQVSMFVNAVNQMESCLREAVTKVDGIPPMERPAGFPFDQWHLATPLQEFSSTRHYHLTTGELSMALTPVQLAIQAHLALFAAQAPPHSGAH